MKYIYIYIMPNQFGLVEVVFFEPLGFFFFTSIMLHSVTGWILVNRSVLIFSFPCCLWVSTVICILPIFRNSCLPISIYL